MVAKRRASGSLESEVLAALWAAERPLTTAEVAEALDSGLAYTTVQTILARLHDKGGDRAAVLTRFVGTLTPAEESTLAALLGKSRDRAGEA